MSSEDVMIYHMENTTKQGGVVGFVALDVELHIKRKYAVMETTLNEYYVITEVCGNAKTKLNVYQPGNGKQRRVCINRSTR